jgi:hypothetical protein
MNWFTRRTRTGESAGTELNACGFAPAYDDPTRAIEKWPVKYGYGVQFQSGVDASEGELHDWLDARGGKRVLMVFAGHGAPDALLTDAALSTRSRNVGGRTHGVLMDEADAAEQRPDLHVVAWACDAGQKLGASINGRAGCGFVGFSGALDFVYGDDQLERVWAVVLGDLIARVRTRGFVDSTDRAWLEARLREMRRAVRAGTFDCGAYRELVSTFLRSAAGLVAGNGGIRPCSS